MTARSVVLESVQIYSSICNNSQTYMPADTAKMRVNPSSPTSSSSWAEGVQNLEDDDDDDDKPFIRRSSRAPKPSGGAKEAEWPFERIFTTRENCQFLINHFADQKLSDQFIGCLGILVQAGIFPKEWLAKFTHTFSPRGDVLGQAMGIGRSMQDLNMKAMRFRGHVLHGRQNDLEVSDITLENAVKRVKFLGFWLSQYFADKTVKAIIEGFKRRKLLREDYIWHKTAEHHEFDDQTNEDESLQECSREEFRLLRARLEKSSQEKTHLSARLEEAEKKLKSSEERNAHMKSELMALERSRQETQHLVRHLSTQRDDAITRIEELENRLSLDAPLNQGPRLLGPELLPSGFVPTGSVPTDGRRASLPALQNTGRSVSDVDIHRKSHNHEMSSSISVSSTTHQALYDENQLLKTKLQDQQREIAQLKTGVKNEKRDTEIPSAAAFEEEKAQMVVKHLDELKQALEEQEQRLLANWQREAVFRSRSEQAQNMARVASERARASQLSALNERIKTEGDQERAHLQSVLHQKDADMEALRFELRAAQSVPRVVEDMQTMLSQTEKKLEEATQRNEELLKLVKSYAEKFDLIKQLHRNALDVLEETDIEDHRQKRKRAEE